MTTKAKRNIGGKHFAFQSTGSNFEVSEGLNAWEAVVRAGLDYPIERRSLYFDQDVRPGGGPWVSQKSRIPGKVALVRRLKDGEEKVLSIVGSDYTVLSNLEIADHLNRLLPGLPVSTVSDRDGRGLFVAVRLAETKIAMDAMEEYILVTDTRDQKNALRVSYFVGRLACHNGLLTGATTRWSVSVNHNKLIGSRFVDILSEFNKKRFAAVTHLERQAAFYIGGDRDEFDFLASPILGAIYPSPKEPGNLSGNPAREMIEAAYERGVRNAKWDRAQVIGLMDRTREEYGGTAYTGYHLLNEVAQYEQHIRPGRSEASVGFSSTFGERANILERAHNVLQSAAADAIG